MAAATDITAQPVAARAGAIAGDRGARLVVWGSWAALLGFVLEQLARHARNVPLAEDWNMVPALVGREGGLWSWLWSQNNEHRLPLPRLVHLGLLEVTHDFRAGMVAGVLLLGAVSAGLILVARRLRGGRTSYLDAFLPLIVLHLGHWENMVWSWQIQFVLSAAAMCALLLVLLGAGLPLRPWPAVGLALSIVALPLTGASGLPYMAAMIAAVAALVWRGGAATRPAAVILCAGAATGALISLAYFVGYESPSWVPANPGLARDLATADKIIAMSLGPASLSVGEPWTALVALVTTLAIGSALLLALRAGVREPEAAERRRALAVAAFLGGSVLLAGALGYGRAAESAGGLPDRYALLAVPGLAGAWLAWQRYGPPRPRLAVHGALLLSALLLLSANVGQGRAWRDWYVAGMQKVERDIAAGTPRDELVRRHRAFLLHWSAPQLARGMDTLHEEGIGPFGGLRR